MDTQNPSAPSRAHARLADNKHPKRQSPYGGGLTHDHSRHTTRFTVIGNHLAQHPELSLVAIGLAAHIQSLPKGARVDIKTLAGRFTEGTTRIAAALRELEAHGYLRRERERVPGGRIITRTISCNQPGRGNGHAEDEPVRPARAPRQQKAPRKPLPTVPQPAYRSPTLLQTRATPPARISSTARTSPSRTGPSPRRTCPATRTRTDDGRGPGSPPLRQPLPQRPVRRLPPVLLVHRRGRAFAVEDPRHP
ncbi:helix-turn-helix domain-containing protein [Streptomyces bottropensis]|uniref:helix-turn-helix domain-containing protein n=1 Tax=Streptomyces bottropensis TaxID=42235 RepID=UPI00369807C7